MDNFEFEVLASTLDEIEVHVGEINKVIHPNQFEPLSTEEINELFRHIHSIKGNARVCNLNSLTFVAHALENILIGLRDKDFEYNEYIHFCLIQFCDQVYDTTEGMKRSAYYQPNLSNLLIDIERCYEQCKMLSLVDLEKKSQSKILIVDDDPDFSHYVDTVLKREFDLTSKLAPNGKKALDLSLDEKYQLIICDYKMPVLNGDQFIHAIRNLKGPNQNSAVIFTTAYDPENLKINNWENVLYLKKPIETSKLIHYSKFGLSNR